MTNTIANRIYLIGMMASGKSTIGKILADRLGYEFIDMDAAIESEYEMSINEIFKVHGEIHFRHLERDFLVKLSKQNNTVIATGGGTPIYHQGIDIMNRTGTVIWLKVSRCEIYHRLLKTSHRPLAAKISKNKLSLLMRERNLIYKQAPIKVWNKGRLEAVVNRIMDKALVG